MQPGCFRRAGLAVLLLAALTSTTSCIAGPRRLMRGWDDTVNDLYSRNAWVHGALLQQIIPVYPIVGFFMAVGDVLVLNPWYFWTDDAWDNDGTGFVHEEPSGPKKTGSVF